MSEIAIYQPQNEVVLASSSPRGELDDWIMVADQVVRLAEVICRSPFVPDGLRGSAPATAAAILTGRELGLPPMTSLANIHVIHGRPGLSAMVMRALIQAQGHEWRDVEVTNTRVVVEGRRKGTADWTRASFSASDAQTAKIQLGGYPQDKLYARASARLARRAFADVIAGMPYSAEEIEDGITEDDGPAADAAPAAEPARRTAQRRNRTAGPTGAAPASGSAQAPQSPQTPAPAPAQAAPSGDGLPPLPGEDEGPTSGGAATSDTGQPSGGDSAAGDAPGDPVSNKRLTAIWTAFTRDFGVGSDDAGKEEVRTACGLLAGRGADLASSRDLTNGDASAVLDTLAHLRAQAAERDESPRVLLLALLERLEEGQAAGE